MSDLRTIRSTLRTAKRWQKALFSAACAERVAPVFRELTGRSSLRAFTKVLDATWIIATTGELLPVRLRQLMAAVPESGIDDSNRPDYYATLALGVLERAIDAAASQDGEAADLVCCQSVDLCSSLDAVAAGSPILTVEPNNPPPPGEIESAELKAQSETLKKVLAAPLTDAALREVVRQQAKAASHALKPALLELIRRRSQT